MQFLSDNAARVHPRVWAAMQAADAPDAGYDQDRLSQRLDAAFSALFGRDCVALWVGSGTAANCLALASMVDPHGAVICHAAAHIEVDECGAPGFFLHGAKLLLADGDGAKLAPAGVEAVLAGITRGVHQAPAQAISVTQASELGCTYQPEELAALGEIARRHGLRLHMDGARFANAVAQLGCAPAAAAGPVDTLAFGCTKNGAMNAEAIVFFDPALADVARWRRKRAGQLQSKGRFLAAQILALIEGGLWLDLAAAANAAAQAAGAGAGARLAHPVQANELFVRLDAGERAALRAQGFAFHDWDDELCRFVASWDTPPDHAAALARALGAL